MLFICLSFSACGISPTPSFKDTVSPDVQIDSPSWGQQVASTFAMTTTVSEPDCTLYFRFNNDLFQVLGGGSGQSTWILNLPVKATNTFDVYAVDSAGNHSATNSREVVWAPIPEVWINDPTDKSFKNSLAYLVKGGAFVDAPGFLNSINLSVNGGAWFNTGSLSFNWTFNFAGFNEGTNTIKAMAVSSDNHTNFSKAYTFYIDTQSPWQNLTDPASGTSGYTSLPNFVIKGTAGDNGISGFLGLYLSINSGPYNLVSVDSNWTVTVNLATGRNHFSFYTLDMSGNSSGSNSCDIYRLIHNGGGLSGDRLGVNLALSSNGNVLAAGSPQAYGNQGRIFVFEKQSGNWVYKAELKATVPQPGDMLGIRMAISADGTTIAAGVTNLGKVLVFNKPTGGWMNNSPNAVLSASGSGINEKFGASVAVSGDGSRIVTSAPWDGFVNSTAGRVFVYNRVGTVWADQNTPSFILISPGLAIAEHLGTSVSISAKGDVIAAGAPGKLGGRGTAYVYTNGMTDFGIQLTNLSLSIGDMFGENVLIAPNGSHIFIGAAGFSGGAGGVFVYPRKPNGGFSNYTAILQPNGGNPAEGFSTVLATDWWGTYLLCGAPARDMSAIVDRGGVYEFIEQGAGWGSQYGNIKYTDIYGKVNDNYGRGIALDKEGRSVLIGVPGQDINSMIDQGAVMFYSR